MAFSMMVMRRVGLMSVVGLALAGCGGGSGSDGSADPVYAERIDAAVLLADEVGSLFNTGFTGQPGEIPATGSATFSGYAVAMFDDAATSELAETLDPDAGFRLLLVGTATLSADFAQRTITGEATDFFGEENGDGRYGDYAGTVAFRDGEIGVTDPKGTSAPNDIRFRYEGSLTGQGNDVALSGDAEGKFKGTPIRGLVAAGQDDNVLNGSPTPSFFGVVAESD